VFSGSHYAPGKIHSSPPDFDTKDYTLDLAAFPLFSNWKDVLSRLASILNPPRLIVVSHRSDDELWTEVLNMGGFDLLRAPLHEMEAVHAVGWAVLDWMAQQRQGQVRWQPRHVATT
jgi:hypothetical protein